MPAINGPCKSGRSGQGMAGLCKWQVLTRAGAYELQLPMAHLATKLDAYPCLWDVDYPF